MNNAVQSLMRENREGVKRSVLWPERGVCFGQGGEECVVTKERSVFWLGVMNRG